MVSELVAAVALIGSAAAGPCPASTVHYERAKHPVYWDTPWVLARPQAPGIAASLPDYARTLRDPRVNRSDGLVLWTRGSKLVWNQPGTVVAKRLGGSGRFRVGEELVFPTAGCWRLTHSGGTSAASVVARVVTPPKTLRCAATLLRSGSALARPRSSGIKGGWPWQTTGPAQLTTHGHNGGLNMKVLWSVRRGWGASLELVGTRLDDTGTFEQDIKMAISPVGFFPSIVDVPAAGCWLFRLRTARLAGVLVVRAVDARG